MIKTNKIPKYTKRQAFTLVSMGVACRNVQITARRAVIDLDDADKVSFVYDLVHETGMANSWSWPNVPENELTSWIRRSTDELNGN